MDLLGFAHDSLVRGGGGLGAVGQKWCFYCRVWVGIWRGSRGGFAWEASGRACGGYVPHLARFVW